MNFCAYSLGFDFVQYAHDHQAIETLMITDDLFRSSDIKTRAKYVKLVEDVRSAGGDVKIFSSLHKSGERMFMFPLRI